MPTSACLACNAPTTTSVTVREMMFGFRDEFVYDECGGCGCVQLRTPPSDEARYYPTDYYSLRLPARRSQVWELARRARNFLMYRDPLGAGQVLASILPRFPRETLGWFAHTKTGRDARILDVGSGIGLLVRDLGEAGFTSVLGIDPYIDGPVRYAAGARVEVASLEQTDGEFDLIMFHHSLEHMRDHLRVLRRAAELLAPDGWCLVRVPIASSYAWRHYREHWVQLDAPRHHVLHSVESLRRVGEAAGLRLERVEHDSTPLQFWGSEAYRRDVPLTDAPALFSWKEMREFARRSRELNARGEGDQACFYFRRSEARGRSS